MKNKAALIIVGIAVALIAVGLLLRQSRETGVAASVRIAANLPMSGALATYGVAVREGASMALDDVQATGAPPMVVDWQDNAGDPKTAVSILRQQLLENPNIYVSGVKPETMAIKDEVSQLNLPHFVWIFDAIINNGTTNNFRTWVSYKIEPPIYIQYAKEHNAQRIAMTYVQLPHTVEEFEKILVPELKKEGSADLLVEPYDFGRTDFKDIAAKIASFKPDLIILNGFQGDLVGLIRSLRPLGAITDGNTIATYDLLDAARILGADEIEGIRIVTPVFETRPDSTKIGAWRKRFRDKYGREPLYTHAFAYDMIGAISAASKTLQLPASSEEWIHALRSVDVDGITGPIRFDSDGDMVTPLEVGVYRGGKLLPDNSK